MTFLFSSRLSSSTSLEAQIKESACSSGDQGSPEPWEDPLEREWQPTPVLFPGEFHGQRILADYSPWTGRPGVLRFMGSQRVGLDWVTELNWTELNSPWGWEESDTTEYASIFCLFFGYVFINFCETCGFMYLFSIDTWIQINFYQNRWRRKIECSLYNSIFNCREWFLLRFHCTFYINAPAAAAAKSH